MGLVKIVTDTGVEFEGEPDEDGWKMISQTRIVYDIPYDKVIEALTAPDEEIDGIVTGKRI